MLLCLCLPGTVLGNFVSAYRFIVDHYSSNHSVSEYRHIYEFYEVHYEIWNFSRDEGNITMLKVSLVFSGFSHPFA
ncbi:hypothetical protein BVRB_7g171100 [Beta vulgaris subsp. vulgaris]|nr:hypothetical protein BVRB_7g171100 [Beta vulgaris subsp. vulgaris]